MGGGRTEQQQVCEVCGDSSRPEYERGVWIPLGTVRCDPCWNRLANELAIARGLNPDSPPHLRKVTETL